MEPGSAQRPVRYRCCSGCNDYGLTTRRPPTRITGLSQRLRRLSGANTYSCSVDVTPIADSCYIPRCRSPKLGRAVALLTAGGRLLQLGDYADASKVFSEALQLEPESEVAICVYPCCPFLLCNRHSCRCTGRCVCDDSVSVVLHCRLHCAG